MPKWSHLWPVGSSSGWPRVLLTGPYHSFIASLLVEQGDSPASSGAFSAPDLESAISPRGSVFLCKNVILELQSGF